MAKKQSPAVNYKVPAFFHSEKPIKPRSKIHFHELPRLCLAFCWPISVPEVAKTYGYSVATARNVYFDFRELLLEPRYRKWHSFALQSAYQTDAIWETVIEELVWSSYAKCYENQECQRNFKYGKRAERECSTCPILANTQFADVLGPDFRQGWLRMVDRTRVFYLDTLRIRKEFGYGPDVFKRRVYHQQIINTARYNSRVKAEDGELAVDHAKEGPGTVRDLWTTILDHIAERGQL